ncbi:hypothetical protein BGX23_012086 [Mortierella sp. AD031]|nr:hypothetical protein BGX23_012086 [Mortierella sp. AD031]KAG0213011.1 hypothetical protein BGX33_003198 [Mortierella sp. NVP41]
MNVQYNIDNNLDVWTKFWNDSRAEAHVPVFWESSEAEAINEFKLLVIKCLRPDRRLAATSNYVDHVFMPNFASTAELDLAKVVQEEVKASTLISL